MPELSSLSESDRTRALERFEFLRPHLESRRSLASLAKEAGIPYRTAQRWLALYQTLGLVGLARRQRNDQGKLRKISTDLKRAIEGLALQSPPLPVAVIHRMACEMAQKRDEPLPSYHFVYLLVTRLPSDLKTLAQEGSKAYGDAFELVHRREADRPNAMWQADHCFLDVLVKKEDGSAAKPWLSVIVDDYSRAVSGYFLAFDAPCAIRTALTLRQAIWRKEDAPWQVCGIPDTFYTDNGSDFTSKHHEQVSADLKMRLVFSYPGQPRGRGRIERIERFDRSTPPMSPTFLATCDGPPKAYNSLPSPQKSSPRSLESREATSGSLTDSWLKSHAS